MNKYKQAVINNTTFDSVKGEVSLQDLYRIPLTGVVSLNAIGTALQKQINENSDSLIVGANISETVFKLAVVKDVIETRQRLTAASAENAKKAERRRNLTQALEVKRMDNMGAMTEEQLEAELKAL